MARWCPPGVSATLGAASAPGARLLATETNSLGGHCAAERGCSQLKHKSVRRSDASGTSGRARCEDAWVRTWYALRMEISRITQDPNVMGGRPCIRGLRVTVGTVLGLLAAGHSEDQILEAHPYLERDDIRASLAYAAWRTQEIEVPLRAS
jgi:uncharacterized protein (DUF433 family)